MLFPPFIICDTKDINLLFGKKDYSLEGSKMTWDKPYPNHLIQNAKTQLFSLQIFTVQGCFLLMASRVFKTRQVNTRNNRGWGTIATYSSKWLKFISSSVGLIRFEFLSSKLLCLRKKQTELKSFGFWGEAIERPIKQPCQNKFYSHNLRWSSLFKRKCLSSSD